MKLSKRFWVILITCIILDAAFTECKKMELNKKEILRIEKRSTSHLKSSIKFLTDVALQGTLMALSVSNPLVGLTGGFIIGTLINVIWPFNSYDAIRANVLEDINRIMSNNEIGKMQMKLRDYKRLIQNLFGILKLPNEYLDEWRKSVYVNEVNFYKQRSIVQKYKDQMSQSSFEYFKKRLLAVNTYIEMDREHFFIPSDPFSSLAYYGEFATIELNLLVAELIIEANENRKEIVKHLRTRIKSAANRHYRFVLWASHKAADKIQSKNTLNWYKYIEVVNSIREEFPLQEWKRLALINNDNVNIRNNEAVSLKFIPPGRFYDNRWLSCWGSGSRCTLRTCPGTDNPFDTGSQYQYHYKCRGEVFWIFGDGRSGSYIRNCDRVALQYSWWSDSNKGYWLSEDEHWFFGEIHNTRTCPGKSFFNSNFFACRSEIFTLQILGKSCGDILQDRDAITLRDRKGNYVGGKWKLAFSRAFWRIYNHDSMIKSYH